MSDVSTVQLRALEIREIFATCELSQESLLRQMAHLEITQPEVANAVLCQFYEIACYKVGDSCFANVAEPIDCQKWFVSFVVGSQFDYGIKIPLSDSEVQAQARAVQYLKLSDVFHARLH